MGIHTIDVMDNGQLIIDSEQFDGNQCEASLNELLSGLKDQGISCDAVEASKKTTMLANPNRSRVRS